MAFLRSGLQLPSFTFRDVPDGALFEHVAGLALSAERAGLDSVWVMDHFYQIRGVGEPGEPMLEGWSTLAALAARTSKVQLGTMVTGVTYRNPALLAKTVTTLDVISSGRAILGIGAAWNDQEHAGYGFEFPPLSERFERLEEALQICRAMLSEERPSFTGRHYRIESALNNPRPVRDHLPILIGGGGEQKTLRLVARYGDGCNLFGDPATIVHKLDVLRRHCEEIGRDPAEITKTALCSAVPGENRAAVEERVARLAAARGVDVEQARAMVLTGDVEQVAEGLALRYAAGLDGVICNLPGVQSEESIELLGKAFASAAR